MYSVIQKRVFTPLPDLPTRIIEAIIILQTQQWHLHLQKILDVKCFVNAIVEFEE